MVRVTRSALKSLNEPKTSPTDSSTHGGPPPPASSEGEALKRSSKKSSKGTKKKVTSPKKVPALRTSARLASTLKKVKSHDKKKSPPATAVLKKITIAKALSGEVSVQKGVSATLEGLPTKALNSKIGTPSSSRETQSPTQMTLNFDLIDKAPELKGAPIIVSIPKSKLQQAATTSELEPRKTRPLAVAPTSKASQASERVDEAAIRWLSSHRLQEATPTGGDLILLVEWPGNTYIPRLNPLRIGCRQQWSIFDISNGRDVDIGLPEEVRETNMVFCKTLNILGKNPHSENEYSGYFLANEVQFLNGEEGTAVMQLVIKFCNCPQCQAMSHSPLAKMGDMEVSIGWHFGASVFPLELTFRPGVMVPESLTVADARHLYKENWRAVVVYHVKLDVSSREYSSIPWRLIGQDLSQSTITIRESHVKCPDPNPRMSRKFRPSDLTIVSSDGVEFFCHWSIFIDRVKRISDMSRKGRLPAANKLQIPMELNVTRKCMEILLEALYFQDVSLVENDSSYISALGRAALYFELQEYLDILEKVITRKNREMDSEWLNREELMKMYEMIVQSKTSLNKKGLTDAIIKVFTRLVAEAPDAESAYQSVFSSLEKYPLLVTLVDHVATTVSSQQNRGTGALKPYPWSKYRSSSAK